MPIGLPCLIESKHDQEYPDDHVVVRQSWRRCRDCLAPDQCLLVRSWFSLNVYIFPTKKNHHTNLYLGAFDRETINFLMHFQTFTFALDQCIMLSRIIKCVQPSVVGWERYKYLGTIWIPERDQLAGVIIVIHVTEEKIFFFVIKRKNSWKQEEKNEFNTDVRRRKTFLQAAFFCLFIAKKNTPNSSPSATEAITDATAHDKNASLWIIFLDESKHGANHENAHQNNDNNQ